MAAKQSQRAEINNFIQGLITESSPLNFPPNASADEENFDLKRDGSRERRLGMDFEPGSQYYDTGIPVGELESAGINTHKWVEVSGSPEIEFLVVQFNQTLYFFDLAAENLSTDGYRGGISLTSFPINTRFSFTSIEGFLVVAAGIDVIAKVEYNTTSLTFSASYDRIRVRDVWGIEENDSRYEVDPSFRGQLDAYHYYNLQNQSWGIERVVFGQSSVFSDPVAAYFNQYALAPSNSEQVWAGLQFRAAQTDAGVPSEQMYPGMYAMVLGSSPNSSRGYFIIDALRRGQSRAEAVNANNLKYPSLAGAYSPNFPSDYTPGGASIVTEFSGRVFYTGFRGEVIDGDRRSPNYVNYVFFSQLVRNGQDITKCYQEGDPTSRESSDILETDGGFLRISEAKDILSLVNIGANLAVIASNGVWLIAGGSDYGFSATNYKVTKLSTFGGLSNTSVVVEGERVYYWAEDGIYLIARNQFGDYEVTNITMNTIQRLYEAIPTFSKVNAQGIYDNSAKKIRWIYAIDNLIYSTGITRELILDVSLGGFSQYRINRQPDLGIASISLFQSSPYQTGFVDELVTVGSDEVFVGAENVIITDRVRSSNLVGIKYLSIRVFNNSVNFNFSFYRNPSFADWESIDSIGVDAKAYCLTGNQTVGDSGVDKQIPYLVMHFRRTEDALDSNFELTKQSSCLVRGQWNFANSVVANKWTPLMQAYRYRKAHLEVNPDNSYDNGFEIVTSKTKLRGRGKAFALYFETEPRKDCKILGWNITVNGNAIT